MVNDRGAQGPAAGQEPFDVPFERIDDEPAPAGEGPAHQPISKLRLAAVGAGIVGIIALGYAAASRCGGNGGGIAAIQGKATSTAAASQTPNNMMYVPGVDTPTPTFTANPSITAASTGTSTATISGLEQAITRTPTPTYAASPTSSPVSSPTIDLPKYKGSELTYRIGQGNLTPDIIAGVLSTLKDQTKGSSEGARLYQLALADPNLPGRILTINFDDPTNTVSLVQRGYQPLSVPVSEKALDGLVKRYAQPTDSVTVMDANSYARAKQTNNFVDKLTALFGENVQISYAPNQGSDQTAFDGSIRDLLTDRVQEFRILWPDQLFNLTTPEGTYTLRVDPNPGFDQTAASVQKFLQSGK